MISEVWEFNLNTGVLFTETIGIYEATFPEQVTSSNQFSLIMLVVFALVLLVAPALGRSLDGRLPFIVHGADVDPPGKYGYQVSKIFLPAINALQHQV